MANIFTLENITDDFSEKINIDELYFRKKEKDIKKLELFNKILNRIHVKIKTTSKIKTDDLWCWFQIPEIIIGVPKFDQAGCIAFLIDKLKTNKFQVQYYHPNLLLISWNHWVPSYVREELKKKTGIEVNEIGEKIDENKTPISSIPIIEKNTKEKKNDSFKPVQSYKPTGKFIYDDLLFNNG